MLKEDPDDLSNLVTTDNSVGCNMNGSLTDANIPSLDDSVPMFGEMFDELMLPDGYGALLPDDISSLDSQSNKIDPFMSYRDESSETVGTPHILSPCLSKVCGLISHIKNKIENDSPILPHPKLISPHILSIIILFSSLLSVGYRQHNHRTTAMRVDDYYYSKRVAISAFLVVYWILFENEKKRKFLIISRLVVRMK